MIMDMNRHIKTCCRFARQSPSRLRRKNASRLILIKLTDLITITIIIIIIITIMIIIVISSQSSSDSSD